jgi:hypothetical protein
LKGTATLSTRFSVPDEIPASPSACEPPSREPMAPLSAPMTPPAGTLRSVCPFVFSSLSTAVETPSAVLPAYVSGAPLL